MDESKEPIQRSTDSDSIDDLEMMNIMSLSDENLADILISKYDYIDSCISNEIFNASLCSNLVLLLKFILEQGPHLDEDINHREQMDMYFTLFRNILRNHLRCLPNSINLLILRLIEIRASKWEMKPNIEEYYMKKVDKLSNNMFQTKNYRSTNQKSSVASSIRMSKSHSDVININNISLDDSHHRNSKLIKMNAKGVYKDEVSIKNSDSGKVMGIKGRRIHMIEEMSDTVISFQKVSPSAKDRLVLISGYNRESIEKAKNLIEVTIRQNISPIPFESQEHCYDTSIDPFDQDTLFAQPNQQLEHSKIKNQPTNNINSFQGDNDHYLFSLNHQNKEIYIKTSDHLIGKKLKYFLNKYRFLDFLSFDNLENLNVVTLDQNKDEPQSCCDMKKTKITYDRDFLISLKEVSIKETNLRLINDIKQKQESLLRK